MQQKTHSIPTRKVSGSEQIDTLPIYIEEWLDSLHYIDFNKTSQLLYEATNATNKQQVKPEARLELVQLYNRPYHYYLDSQIKTGAHHTLQSIEIMQGQTGIMKKIAINLAMASKMGFEETLNKKTMWRQSTPPLQAMLMAMNYLSQALIFSFLEYSPTPKNVWRELNNLYAFAEGIGHENNTILPQGGDPKKDATSISNAYERIALASLIGPYHLPFGAIWEIYDQLATWSEYIRLRPFEKASNPSGYFVADLAGDFQPVPYAKFNPQEAGKKHRLLDTKTLIQQVNKNRDILELGKGLDKSIHLSPYYAKSILKQMSMAWSLPPERYSPRDKRSGEIQLTFGLDAIYYYLNGERDFDVTEKVNENEIIVDQEGFQQLSDKPNKRNHIIESWNLVDQGTGGFAVTREGKPESIIRVGDLVGLNHGDYKSTNSQQMALGLVRWLMVRQNKTYRVGIQTIAADVLPAAIKATSGNVMDNIFRRALVAGDLQPQGENSIITSKGLFTKERELEIQIADRNFRGKAVSLTDSSMNFEHFVLNL